MTECYPRLRSQWLVACESRELGRRPLGVNVHGMPLALFRAGREVAAVIDRCPHRNAPLSAGALVAGRLACPYHGWTFDVAGRCVAAPGIPPEDTPQVSLPRWQAKEQDQLVWVAPPSTPADRPVYRPALAADERYRGFVLSAEIEGDLADALENLLDGTHTPHVHAGLVRSPRQQQEFTAEVRRRDRMVEAEYRGERGQSGWISRLFEPEREVSFGRFVPPCTVELEYRSPSRVELLVVAHFTPRSAERLRVFVTSYLPRGWLPAAAKFAVARPFFRRVLRQDRAILRLQAQNIARFGERAYAIARGDLLRPWIDAWLAAGEFPPQQDGPHKVHFNL